METVEYVDTMEFVEYTVGVTAKGNLKAFGRANKNQTLKVNTDSKSQLVMFTNKGNVIKIAAFLIQEAIKNEVPINNLVDGLESTEKIVALFSLKEFR